METQSRRITLERDLTAFSFPYTVATQNILGDSRSNSIPLFNCLANQNDPPLPQSSLEKAALLPSLCKSGHKLLS